MEGALFFQNLPYGARPNPCVAAGQEHSLMGAAVIYANSAIVQIGPQGFRRLVFQAVMLYQPSAQRLLRGYSRNNLIEVYPARLYLAGDSKHIVQALLRLRIQRFGQMVEARSIQPVQNLRQLIQFLECEITVQPDVLEMPAETGDGGVC